MLQGIAETPAELQEVGRQLRILFHRGSFRLSYWFINDINNQLVNVADVGIYSCWAITVKMEGAGLILSFWDEENCNTLTLPVGIGVSFKEDSVVITNFRERPPEDYPLSVSLYIRLC